MRKATNIERKKLVSMGTCFGKFTKSGKFKLQITALDYLAQYARVVLLILNSETSSEFHFQFQEIKITVNEDEYELS
jgi:ribosome biogenesis protein Nip4